MKKIIALLAVVAASSFAQAQPANHPDARNDRAPMMQSDRGDSGASDQRAHRRHAARHHTARHHNRKHHRRG
ncbi:MAG: hypothetical protein NVSMB6_17920 [Burkholderiaceae bacterium]